MIIKGLFRRYERWNPVHPTSGAFWGMGIGFGCGIGWGPGFGPEVIGYVGAGCGVGFSVGITLAGFGVGLPANRLLKVPFSGTVLSFVFIDFWFISGGFNPFTYYLGCVLSLTGQRGISEKFRYIARRANKLKECIYIYSIINPYIQKVKS
ncbi:putative cadmium-induced protein AS8 [Helianthus annuus]|nr:putative cadmium-induced protein AS8 [Helianthus annuus]